MARVIVQMTVQLPRLMEVGECRKLRYAGGKPSLQQLKKKHLQELGVTYSEASHLKMLTGIGQSMAPTIQHLDPMIVDVSIRDFQGDSIYAFSWQQHFYVKRLQVADSEHFEMISDNPNHKDRLIRIDETYIQARVLLIWNVKKA